MKRRAVPLRSSRRWIRGFAVAAILTGVAGCRQDMHDQPKYEPLESSAFFDDQRASRPFVPGTVARGFLEEDERFSVGKANGEFVTAVPVPVTMEALQRGRERYDIFCSPCHDRVGSGRGMIVQRGYRQPPSFHIERLRTAEVGYLYDVISHGFGVMPGYAAQVPGNDRWAIVAYIRALQLSQSAPLDAVPPAQRAELARKEGP